MRAIGIILAGGNSNRMRELSQKRAIAAMPIAGSYRSIDFALSNMTNSHIQKVAVFTQYNSRSLNEHLSSSKWWDFGRKQGGLYGIYKLDYGKVLEHHIEKGADITVVCKDLANEPEQLERFGVVKTNADGRIIDFEEKPLVADSTIASIGVYIVRRRLLIELLENCAKEDRTDFVKDILIRHKTVKRIYSYMMDSYWSNVGDADAYYKTNMDFLNRDIRNYFFKQYPDVYSKVDDLPPAKYNPGSEVKNSLIASGCIINGTVENSILFKEVFVGSNCVIKNSIILNDVYIGDNVHIENCIVESRDTIRANSKHIGDSDKIKIVIEKNSRYIL